MLQILCATEMKKFDDHGEQMKDMTISKAKNSDVYMKCSHLVSVEGKETLEISKAMKPHVRWKLRILQNVAHK